MGYAQLVIGPAGSGKSTYCSSLYRHCETMRRTINIINLDPAAENFDYPVAVDIRELINLEDVMEELGLGPNGGLIYCTEELEDCLVFFDDDYLVFDCPLSSSLMFWFLKTLWSTCSVRASMFV